MAKYASQAPIEYSGYTLQHDELVEWCDEEASQHGVQINREWRGLPDLFFYFGMQSEAHALFMALCQAENVTVDGEELPTDEPEDEESEVNYEAIAQEARYISDVEGWYQCDPEMYNPGDPPNEQ